MLDVAYPRLGMRDVANRGANVCNWIQKWHLRLGMLLHVGLLFSLSPGSRRLGFIRGGTFVFVLR